MMTAAAQLSLTGFGPAVDGVPVRISAASMRQPFQGCHPDYIRDVCHGACCRSGVTAAGSGAMVHPDEQARLEALGATVVNHRLMPDPGGCHCRFQTDVGHCTLHATAEKPFACVSNPFMLNAGDTLIVQNRYRRLRCYGAEPRLPAYRAFGSSLVLLFGPDGAARITTHLDAGGGDLTVPMRSSSYRILTDVARFRRDPAPVAPAPAAPVVAPPLTPVERHGGIAVKRDDLFRVAGVNGGKARAVWAMAHAAPIRGIVSAGSRTSGQVNIVARIAADLGVPCRCHTPTGDVGPGPAAAERAGAELVRHRAGYGTVLAARARDDAAQRGWLHIPFRMETPDMVAHTAPQVGNVPPDVRRIVVPVGSGMSLAGILTGLAARGRTTPVVGVMVGPDPTPRLDRYAPAGWRDRLTLVQSPRPYGTPGPLADIDGVPLDPVYESWAAMRVNPGDLLWIVGGPP